MELPPFLASALRWPIFIFSVCNLFWPIAWLGAVYKIKWLNVTKKRNDVLACASGMKSIHQLTILKVGPRELYRQKCMYLCNHRCWADFMVDQYVTEGRSVFMSRLAVPAAFPFIMLPLWFTRTVILFKRGAIANKDRFNQWVDKKFAESPQTGLAIYPEGHRSTTGQSLPLKRGMIKYAYSRNLPVQIVISANKEGSISEKRHIARFRQTAAVGYSEVIIPKEYPDFDTFMAKVQQVWDKEWNEVFSADWEGLPVLPEPEPETFDYPMDIRVYMLLSVLFNFMAFGLLLRVCYGMGLRVMGMLGPLQWPALVLFAGYVLASFLYYSQPLHVKKVRQKMLEQRVNAPRLVATAPSSGETEIDDIQKANDIKKTGAEAEGVPSILSDDKKEE